MVQTEEGVKPDQTAAGSLGVRDMHGLGGKRGRVCGEGYEGADVPVGCGIREGTDDSTGLWLLASARLLLLPLPPRRGRTTGMTSGYSVVD